MVQKPKTELLKGLYKNSLEQSLARRETLSISDLERLALQRRPLECLSYFDPNELSVIAEIKRASPSKGHLADIDDPVALGTTYQQAGASAISVLTEESGFKGSIRDLELVSEKVDIPTLRKDFISTKEQILEARAHGASMVLLIMLGLDDRQFAELFSFATELELGVLVETHSAEEIERALSEPVQFLGINTRNLNTFETDINLFAELSELLPEDVVKIAESAVRGIEDASLYRRCGADAVLVGEALVTGDAKSLIENFRLASQ